MYAGYRLFKKSPNVNKPLWKTTPIEEGIPPEADVPPTPSALAGGNPLKQRRQIELHYPALQRMPDSTAAYFEHAISRSAHYHVHRCVALKGRYHIHTASFNIRATHVSKRETERGLQFSRPKTVKSRWSRQHHQRQRPALQGWCGHRHHRWTSLDPPPPLVP